jgi:LuxR family transcriptional regulator, maltose regulon positive regulatory protein
MQEGLLKTKLFPPPLRPNQVSRKPLIDKLNSAREAGIPCALVSAPAGFGKTTLVGDWARASGLPYAWLALDGGDNDLLRFWRYVDAALQTIDNHIGESLRPALYTTQAPSIQQIITGLINDIISLEMDFILVLEDYHLIEDSEVHDSLNFLLDHMPSQMQLVITTRSDPPLNLARRRGRRQMVEIRATDLRFTPEEIAAFLNQTMLLDLSDADIAALDQRTEGWIAGLQMVALSMQDENDRHAFVAAFSGDDHYIADFLMEEVLQRQPVEFQEFLQQTSILDRLNAALCDAVTGRQDSRAMLNALERANLFLLPLDNRREWFRYHHLFGELLQKRLRETHTTEDIAGLHRLASTWHETQGDIPAAIRHAFSIPDETRILQLLENNVAGFFAAGELPQLSEIVKKLPPHMSKGSPFLCICVAWAGVATNLNSEVPAWLNAIETHFGLPAESALKDPTLDAPRRAALLEVLVVRLQLPFSHSRSEQRALILAIRDQLNLLPPEQNCLLNPVFNLKPVIAFDLGSQAEESGDLPLAVQAFTEAIALSRQTYNNNLFHLAAGHLANLQFAMGQLHAARQTHEQALSEAKNLGQMVSPYVALSHAGLGVLHYEWNDLAAAEYHFNEGLAHARLWNQWESLVPLALGRARLKLRAGDSQSALDILGELDSPPREDYTLSLKAFSSRLLDADSASAWLAAYVTESMLEPNPVNEACLLDIARLLASLQRSKEALALLQKIIHFAQSGGRTNTLIRAKVAMAIEGDQPDALVEALQLAEPEGYISTFVDEGESMQSMLSQVIKKPRIERHISAYVRKLLSAFVPALLKPQPTEGLTEPLSEREVEVLRYMAEGLSNPEIARLLYLSPNTLKAHAQNIFLKLDVHNRLQAVGKAKELGLIR